MGGGGVSLGSAGARSGGDNVKGRALAIGPLVVELARRKDIAKIIVSSARPPFCHGIKAEFIVCF